MRIVKFLLITWLAALAVVVAAAPAPRAGGGTRNPRPSPTSCPTVTVSCPDESFVGKPITFTANISGGDSAVTPTFKWKVSGSKIMIGERDSSMTVEPLAQGGKVEATVEIGGYDSACTMTASCTTHIVPVPLPRKFGEYGNLKLNDEWARLDKFAEELLTDSTAQGFFICYGGRRSTAGEAQRRCDRARRYTNRYPWADPTRLVTVDAGYRCEPSVELWLVPEGAQPPADAPLTVPEPKPSAAKCRPHRRRAQP